MCVIERHQAWTAALSCVAVEAITQDVKSSKNVAAANSTGAVESNATHALEPLKCILVNSLLLLQLLP